MVNYLANSMEAYGFGKTEAEALGNVAAHARHGDEPLEVTIVRYESDAEATVVPGGYSVEGGDVFSEQTFRLEREALGEIDELASELELLVESTLEESEEVEA